MKQESYVTIINGALSGLVGILTKKSNIHRIQAICGGGIYKFKAEDYRSSTTEEIMNAYLKEASVERITNSQNLLFITFRSEKGLYPFGAGGLFTILIDQSKVVFCSGQGKIISEIERNHLDVVNNE